jgi:2,3-bisphosphoglycerate-dependent phosphoglycerate mutase
MIILVIRHGESEADILDVHEGRADFALTERGRRQASAMAKYVAERYKLTRIYASTLRRAAQTAKHLSEASGVAVEFDSDLMEFNNGLLAGLSREDADRQYPEVKDLPVDQAVYGQESKVEFRNRAEKMLHRILSENGPEDIVAVVTHGGMVNQLYGALFHTPVGEDSFFCTADTGIHIWNITDRGNYVVKANVDEHIRGI